MSHSSDDPTGEGVANWGAEVRELYDAGNARGLIQLLDRGFWRGAHAEEALEAIGSSAVQPLIEALEDPSPQVRKSAALCLGNIGDRSAAPALLKVFRKRDPLTLRGPDYGAWSVTMQALGALGSSEIGATVVEYLQRGSEHPEEDLIDLTQDAALTLGLLGDEQYVPALIDALDTYLEQPFIAGWILDALRDIGGPVAENVVNAHDGELAQVQAARRSRLSPEEREREDTQSAKIRSTVEGVVARSRPGSVKRPRR